MGQTHQTGSVAVVVALILTLLLGVMAFSMDTGYLYLKKNQYQNAVEAAALAGAMALCDEDRYEVESVVMEIASKNGIPVEKGELTVGFGYFDEMNQYSDFSEYRDFTNEEDMPTGEYVNAVHVVYKSEPLSLTGMGQDASLSNAAVAYLQRIDMASLDPDGAIHIGHNSIWENVLFFSNGQIKYPKTITAEGKTYSPPEFNNCDLLAVGNVLSCPAIIRPIFPVGNKIEIHWDSRSPQSTKHIQTVVDSIETIRPVDEDTIEKWRQKADIVYTLDQVGQDNIYYGQGTGMIGSDSYLYYYVDPAADLDTGRRIIFFDAGNGEEGSVLLGPWPASTAATPHRPNGYNITSLTFIATCPIRIANYGRANNTPALHVGGAGDDQALIISTEHIEVYPNFGSGTVFDGVVFRTGGDFIKYEYSSADTLHHIRVIADGDILGEEYDTYTDDSGLNNFWNDSRFGPPCPPAMARLGRLVSVPQ